MDTPIENHIALLIACIVGVEILKKSNTVNKITSINTTISKVLKVIRSSKINDHWKEKVIPFYAMGLFKKSSTILLTLILILGLFLAFSVTSQSFLPFIMSPLGVIESLVVAFAWVALRRKQKI